jgi:hypothetical protein
MCGAAAQTQSNTLQTPQLGHRVLFLRDGFGYTALHGAKGGKYGLSAHAPNGTDRPKRSKSWSRLALRIRIGGRMLMPTPANPEPRKRSYTDEVIARRKHMIRRFKAKDTTGQWACYFVVVLPHQEHSFMNAMTRGDEIINLDDYCRVIASCYGERPTDEVKEMMRERFDYEVL